MPKENEKGSSSEARPSAAHKNRVVEKAPGEPVINIGGLGPKRDPSLLDSPVINGGRRRLATTRNGSADKLLLVPPKNENPQPSSRSQGSKGVSAKDPSKNQAIGQNNLSPTTKNNAVSKTKSKTGTPGIDPAARQEIYGILLVVGAFIFFFGLISNEGFLALAGGYVKRLFGIGSFLIPVLIFIEGLTFFWEGLTKQERFNQLKISAGVLLILSFICLVHLFAANPKQMAENGEGGGYLAFFLDAFQLKCYYSFNQQRVN